METERHGIHTGPVLQMVKCSREQPLPDVSPAGLRELGTKLLLAVYESSQSSSLRAALSVTTSAEITTAQVLSLKTYDTSVTIFT